MTVADRDLPSEAAMASAVVPAAEDLAAAAAELAEEIVHRALPTPDGGVTWRARRPARDGDGREERQIGPHLYHGTAGVALALAALARELGEPAWEETARRALEPLRRRLSSLVRQHEEASRLRLGLGALVGVPSMLYALLRVGTLLGDRELMAEAADLLVLCSPQRIADDSVLDVVGGSAGGAMVFATLGRCLPAAGPRARQAMHQCANRLAAGAVRQSAGVGWKTLPAHPPLTGFAHGAAGIACALAAVHAATDDPEPLALARQAVIFENSHYQAGWRNWSDLRSGREGCMNSWCHGAPGIALSRLAMHGYVEDEELRRDLHAALASTMDPTLVRPDHICCGNLGRAEVLLAAYRVLGQRAHLDAARRIATAVLQRRRRRGHYSWTSDDQDEGFDPSLFTGAAGLALVMARLARPWNELPSVLLLE